MPAHITIGNRWGPDTAAAAYRSALTNRLASRNCSANASRRSTRRRASF